MALNQAPETWDGAAFSVYAFRIHDALRAEGLAGGYAEFLRAMFWKAPMTCVWPVPFIALLGRGADSVRCGNFLFIPALVIYVFCFGRLFLGRFAACAAAFIVAMFPLLYGLANCVLAEYALTVWVTAAMFHFMASDGLRHSRHAIALGVVIGFGVLTKLLFLFYVFPACVVAAVIAIGRARREGWRGEAVRAPAVAVGAIVLIAACMAGPWYAQNLRAVLLHSFYSAFSGAYSKPAAAYLAQCMTGGVSPWLSLVAVMAIVCGIVLWRRGRLRWSVVFPPTAAAFLGAWALPLIVFLFGSNKDVRFIAPVLPAFGIALAALLGGVADAAPRWRGGICLVLAPAFFFAVEALFGFDGRNGRNGPNGPVSGAGAVRGLEASAYGGQPSPEQWPLAQIIGAAIEASRRGQNSLAAPDGSPRPRTERSEKGERAKRGEDAEMKEGTKTTEGAEGKEGTERPVIVVVSDAAHFNNFTLQLEAVRIQAPVDLRKLPDTNDRRRLLEAALGARCLLAKTGGEPEAGQAIAERGELLAFVTRQGLFREERLDAKMPDGSQVALFVRQDASGQTGGL